MSSLAPPTRDGLQARLDRAALLGHRPAAAAVQRADVKLDQLSLDVVLFYTKLDPATLRLIKDTPEESFAVFYTLDSEAQIGFLRGLQQFARLALQLLTRSSGSRPMLEGGSASSRQPFGVEQAYRGFLQLNPNFVGELLNLATGGTATIRGFSPQGGQQTLVLGGGLQALTSGGLLALTGPEVGTPTTSTGLVKGGLSPRPLDLSHDLRVPSRSKSGLAGRLNIERFSQVALGLLAEWQSLEPEERALRMLEAANQELATLGIPPCGILLVPKSALGEFAPTTWTIELQRFVFERLLPSPAELADLADTVYHEARHAEQFFRIVNYLSATGKSKSEIQRETGIPANIVEAGYSPVPRKGGERDLQEGQYWYESIFGKKAAERRETLLGYREIKKELSDLEDEYVAKFKELRKLQRRCKEGAALVKSVFAQFKKVDLEYGQLEDLVKRAEVALATEGLDKKYEGLVATLKGNLQKMSPNLGVAQQVVKQLIKARGVDLNGFQELRAEVKELQKSLELHRDVYELYYEQYRQLPEEQDAFDVGGRVSQLLQVLIPELSDQEQLSLELEAYFAQSGPSTETGLENLEESGEDLLLIEPDASLAEEVENVEEDEPHPFLPKVERVEKILNTYSPHLQKGIALLGPLLPQDNL